MIGSSDTTTTFGGAIGFNYSAVPTFTPYQIGYTISQPITSTPGSLGAIGGTSTLGIGVWLLTFCISATSSTGNFVYTYLSTQSIAERRFPYVAVPTTTNYNATSSMILTITSSSSFSLNNYTTGVTLNTGNNYSFIYLTRIA